VEVSGVPVGTRFEVKASVAGGGNFSYLAYVRRGSSSAVTLMASGSQVTWPVAGAAFEANKQNWDISKAVVGIKDTITVGLGIETPAGQPTPEGSVDFRIRTNGPQPDYAVAVEPGYFSDFAEVRVNSKGTWALFATSGGTSRKIKTGNGNLTFAWGSRPLPDGAYNLSLVNANGLETAAATATIDTVAPTISDGHFSDATVNDKPVVTVAVQGDDSGSGLDAASLAADLGLETLPVGAPFDSEGVLLARYEIQEQDLGGPLKLKVSVADRAGNKTVRTFEQSLEVSFETTYSFDAGYRVATLGTGTPVSDLRVFYPHCSGLAQIRTNVTARNTGGIPWPTGGRSG